MQIFAGFIINIGYVILGIVQMIEVKVNGNAMESKCLGLIIEHKFLIFEFPHVVTLTILAIVLGFLSYKLYQQFGWNIYKKIGGDIDMQKRFKTYLIFVMLMKIDLFFVIVFNALVSPFMIYETIIEDGMEAGIKVFLYGYVVILFLSLIFQVLAYKSLEKEWRAGMIVFIIFWFIALLDFGFLVYLMGALLIPYKLFSLVILASILLICALLTFVYAIMVTRNFDKGLREYLDKDSPKNTHEGSNILSDVEKGPSSNDENPNRFIIDDD
ncbi:3889_t:CDS:2 [Funneliformis geosporum]|uniref:3889_t:CDS:1 n=1 Tax=Funneliformis geosporum TaxID=1117311 RepID=A0A9W4SH45_9GLOM|nr:3889_t:CDS:2 [Funneliformis geosporum]